MSEAPIFDDVIQGTGAIALELYGANTAETRRKTAHLHRKGDIPTFKLGNSPKAPVMASRTALREYFRKLSEGPADNAGA